MKIKKIKKVVLDKPKKFYDITVDVYHNFLITKDNLVTHNTSLEDTIIGMGQPFKNNIELFDIEGQWGFLRVPQAGASRYIGCTLNSNFYQVFKDFNLAEKQFDEGKEIEPKYYLPIIPMILINGSQGIAVGFASKILNRDPNRIIDVCIKYLKGEKFNNTFKPFLKEFNGKIEQDKDNPLKWWFQGKFERVNSTTVRIIEYSPEMSYEKIEKHLLKKEEEKKIVSYENNSKDKIDIIVKFKREFLAEATDQEIRTILNLDSSITENLTILDQNEKIQVFNDIFGIIKYFVDFRLEKYKDRKKFIIDQLTKDITLLSNKANFIKSIIDGKLVINNKPKEQITKNLEKMNFSLINDSYSYLLNLPMYSLTKENYTKLKADLKTKKSELAFIKKKTEKDMYIEDLENLRDNLKL
jgi:DNA topoisomerase-2